MNWEVRNSECFIYYQLWQLATFITSDYPLDSFNASNRVSSEPCVHHVAPTRLLPVPSCLAFLQCWYIVQGDNWPLFYWTVFRQHTVNYTHQLTSYSFWSIVCAKDQTSRGHSLSCRRGWVWGESVHPSLTHHVMRSVTCIKPVLTSNNQNQPHDNHFINS